MSDYTSDQNDAIVALNGKASKSSSRKKKDRQSTRLRAKINEGGLSDDNLALTFGDEYLLQNARYVSDLNEWVSWDGARWLAAKDNKITQAGREFLRSVADDLVNLDGAKELSDGDLSSLYDKLGSVGKLRALVQQAQTNPGIGLMAGDFDSNPLMLNTPAGMVNLTTGEIRPPNTSDLVTRITGVAPENGDPVEFLKFMEWASCGDVEWVEYLQRVAGMTLIGHGREQKFFFFYGSGGNGKSVFEEVSNMVLGNYSAPLSSKYLTLAGANDHTTGLVNMKGARKVMASEIPKGQSWNMALIKSMTGDENFEARRMRQDFVSFPVTWTLTITGNSKPRLDEVNAAVRRRMVLVPWRQSLDNVEEKLGFAKELFDKEGGRILNWMIEGARKYLEHGLPECKAVDEATKSYVEAEDKWTEFAEQYLEFDKDGFVSRNDLALLFEHYAHGLRMTTMSGPNVERALIEYDTRIHPQKPHRGPRGVGGVRVHADKVRLINSRPADTTSL